LVDSFVVENNAANSVAGNYSLLFIHCAAVPPLENRDDDYSAVTWQLHTPTLANPFVCKRQKKQT